ncbi:MAG: hypothetical protein K0Q90_119 [Paenibacillaceae bacterium]|jgi:hypothetical protein|nr:hypothetical protein [Paenibacillaceae bacterium]
MREMMILFPIIYKPVGQTVLAALVLAGAAAWGAPGITHAAETRLTVTLPTFQVTLNGQRVDNRNRGYPLIVYKDITYFPMTWYDSRHLGLENTWSADQGLSVQQSSITAFYHDYASGETNTASSYRAELADGPITVNGQIIDNRTEEYPLLSFRDVTYFPLTWRYAHDAFGWEYDWSDSSGLSIRSANPQVKDAGLLEYAAGNGFAVYQGYYYFAETDGAMNHIYRSPINDPGAREHVYEYVYSTDHRANIKMGFLARDGALWLYYHIGGGIMGSDRYVKLNEDGTAGEELSGYIDFADTPIGRLVIDYGVPPSGNNLHLLPPGEAFSLANISSWAIGNPSMIYGWAITTTPESGTAYTKGGLGVEGASAYVLVSPYPETKANQAEGSRIWKLGLEGGKQAAISQESVSRFKITSDGRILYVKTADGLLYASDLDGQHEALLSGQHKVHEFDSVGGTVFFTVLQEDGWTYRLYKAVGSGRVPEAVSEEAFSSVQFTDSRILAQTPGNMPTLNIYDDQGKLLTRIAGKAESVYTDGKLLLLKLEDEPSLKVFQF